MDTYSILDLVEVDYFEFLVPKTFCKWRKEKGKDLESYAIEVKALGV